MGGVPALTQEPGGARRWARGSALAGLLALAAAVLYRLSLPALERSAAAFYPEHEAWRQALLIERLRGYASLLWVLSGLLACWWLVVRERRRLNALQARIAAPITIVAATLIVWVLNYLFSTREWVSLGRPCWDNYCYYAELLSKWLSGQNVERRLLAFMREDYHSNSPMGPLLIAGLRLVTGLETVVSYRLCVSLATLASVLLLWRGLLGLVKTGREEAGAALLLFCTHFIVVRSSFFPQSDAFVLLWSTALIVVAAGREAHPRPWHGAVCFALLVTGLFVKLSFLPALLLLPAWRAAAALASRRMPDWRALATDVLLYSLLPFSVFLLVQQRLGLLRLYGVELHAIAGSDSNLPFVAMSLVHAAALLGPLAWLGRRRFGVLEAPLLAWTFLYLAALWLSRASGWDRFYLALLPPLTAMAAHGLSVVKQELGPGPLWAGVLLVAALNYAALWLKLYY